jgi:hypothetical protein
MRARASAEASAMRFPVRSIVVALALLALAAVAGARPAASASSVELFRNEAFGLFVRYDAGRWPIADRQTVAGSGLVRVSDGAVAFIAFAFDRPGTSPRGRLESGLGRMARNDAVAGAASPAMPPGEPEVADLGAGASVDHILTLPAGDGPRTLAARERCGEPVPGASHLYPSIEVPGGAWNAGRGFDGSSDAPGRGCSVYPWPAWFAPGSERFVPVADAGGVAVGLIQRTAPGQNGEEQVLAVRACDRGPGLALDPSRIVATERTFDSPGAPGPLRSWPIGAEWLLPAAAAAGPFAVRPGEIAALRVPIERPAVVTDYASPVGSPRVALGSGGGGCGAGGAR